MAYHIRKDGTPGICHAKPGNCPLGGEGEHFDTMREAQNFIDNANEDNFGLLNVTSTSELIYSLQEKSLSKEEVNTFDSSVLLDLRRGLDHRDEEMSDLIETYSYSDNEVTKALAMDAKEKHMQLDIAKEKHEAAVNELLQANNSFRSKGGAYVNQMKDLYQNEITTPVQTGAMVRPFYNPDLEKTLDPKMVALFKEQNAANLYEIREARKDYMATAQEKQAAEAAVNEAENNLVYQVTAQHESYVASEFGDSHKAHQAKKEINVELSRRQQLMFKGLDVDKKHYDLVGSDNLNEVLERATVDPDNKINNLWACTENGPALRVIRFENDYAIGEYGEREPMKSLDYYVRPDAGTLLSKIK